MAEPERICITQANLKNTVGIISGYIREYEKMYEQGTDSKEWQRNKRDFQNRLIAGLEVLSAVTGHGYHWARHKLNNGKIYSGVIRPEQNGSEDKVYDNCAEVLKCGVSNG